MIIKKKREFDPILKDNSETKKVNFFHETF